MKRRPRHHASEVDLWLIRRRFIVSEHRRGRLSEPAARHHLMRLGASAPEIENEIVTKRGQQNGQKTWF